MFSIFSFSESPSLTPQTLDLQLLSDDELLSIWEQTQLAEIMLVDKGIPPKNINTYTRSVEAEIQARAIQDKNSLIWHVISNKDTFKNYSEVNNDFDLF